LQQAGRFYIQDIFFLPAEYSRLASLAPQAFLAYVNFNISRIKKRVEDLELRIADCGFLI
jgi:hypothetical protein